MIIQKSEIEIINLFYKILIKILKVYIDFISILVYILIIIIFFLIIYNQIIKIYKYKQLLNKDRKNKSLFFNIVYKIKIIKLKLLKIYIIIYLLNSFLSYIHYSIFINFLFKIILFFN